MTIIDCLWITFITFFVILLVYVVTYEPASGYNMETADSPMPIILCLGIVLVLGALLLRFS